MPSLARVASMISSGRYEPSSARTSRDALGVTGVAEDARGAIFDLRGSGALGVQIEADAAIGETCVDVRFALELAGAQKRYAVREREHNRTEAAIGDEQIDVRQELVKVDPVF